MNMIFLGAPGAGKGTQADQISELYRIPAISTGVLLREAIKAGTELGRSAENYVNSGGLVPDEIVIGIIKARLAENDCANGYILDGFPRTAAQAQALLDMNVNIDLAISIEVSDADIVSRMSGRRVCECGASYHIEFNPPKMDGVCDKDSNKLNQRDDDKPEVVLERLAVYHEKTAPIKDFYENLGKLVIVCGQQKVADTSRLTREAIAKAGFSATQ